LKKKIILVFPLFFFLFIFSSCASHSFRNNFSFGNSLAKKGLWKEAGYRWKKSINNGNKSAAVHNNLAVSYEFQGKLKKALLEYQTALKIEPGNEKIRRNLEKLKIRMGMIKKPESKKNKKKRGNRK